MMTIIVAPPGGGKTTTGVRFAIRALHHKKLFVGHLLWKVFFTHETYYDRVYANFSIPGCYRLKKEDLGQYDFHYSLLIIDEASMEFDSRDFKNFSEQYKEFFSQHRHQHCDVIVITQEYGEVDKRIRNNSTHILYVKPWGFGCIQIIPVNQSEPDFERHMQSYYFKAPPLSCTIFPQWIYRKYFDSYSCKPLPPNPAELWADSIQEKSIFVRVKEISFSVFHKMKNFFSPSDTAATMQNQKVAEEIAESFEAPQNDSE